MKKNSKIIITAFVLSLPLWWGFNILQEKLENALLANISEPLQNTFIFEIDLRPKLEIEAEAAMSVRINQLGEKRKIMFQKNTNEILPIASLTKLMTALVVLDNSNEFDLSKVITISKKAAGRENAMVLGSLTVNEKYTLDKLFELMLVYSSNDAAWALSEIMGVENFVARMNDKATKIGMKNTHFLNPTGLDPDIGNPIEFDDPTNFNYSTAEDLTILSQYISEKYPSIFEYSLHPESHYSIENGISVLVLSDEKKVIGGKTGYTDAALGCITFVYKDKKGNSFFNIILRSENKETRIYEMQKLVNWLSL
ncbi:D-alanyl-D-alanine carboxypeptidase family protein [Patescibacteria group bacterium]